MANDQFDSYLMALLAQTGNTGPYVSPSLDPFSGGITPPMTQQIGDGLASTGSQTKRPSAYDEPLSNRAEEEYWKLLSNVPRRKEPGKWRRLGSALATLKPGQTQQRLEDLKYPGYRQQVEDWQLMENALKTPMLQERLENQGIRTARRYETTADIQAQRYGEIARHNREIEAIRRAHTGGVKVIKQENGNIFLLYPDGRLEDTGKPSNTMTKAEELELEVEIKNPAELELIKARGEEARKTAAVPTTSTVTTISPATPTPQTAVDEERYNRADDLKKKFPGLNGFVQVDPKTKEVQIKDVGTQIKIGGLTITLDENLYNYIYEHIYQNKPLPPEVTQRFSTTQRGTPPVQNDPIQPPPPGTARPNQPPINQPTNQPTNQRPTAPPGRVIIMKDGKVVGTIPIEQRDQAIKEGYAVVK
jgi:hypothetical protein